MYKNLPYDENYGVVVTDLMDQEIDRILPIFQAQYPVARQEKKRNRIGELKFVNPYNNDSRAVPVMVDYNEDEQSGWGWASFSTVAVNAAFYQEIKDWQYRRVLAHEVIHLVDPTRKPGFLYFRPKDGMVKYLTQPCEFNAFSGMMAYSIRKNAKVWNGTEYHEAWVKGIEETFAVMLAPKDYMQKHKKAGIFDAYYASLLWEYEEILSADRFALFKGRIHLALLDAKAHLEGKSETPFVELEREEAVAA